MKKSFTMLPISTKHLWVVGEDAARMHYGLRTYIACKENVQNIFASPHDIVARSIISFLATAVEEQIIPQLPVMREDREKDAPCGAFENYEYRKKVSHAVKNSLIEGEKLTHKFRNRGLTRDKRATVNSVLDNRTLLILKKLKEHLFNEIYGVVSSGKEAYVFNAHKYLNPEELNAVRDILLKCEQRGNPRSGDTLYNGTDEGEEAEEGDNSPVCTQDDENKLYGSCEGESWASSSQDALCRTESLGNDSEKREYSEYDSTNVHRKADETFDLINEIEKTICMKGKNLSTILKHKKVGISFATKVYNTSILIFKKRSQYIEGEFRFRNAYTKNTNPRKMVKQWSEKEFRNLRRILIHGLRCPYPLVLKSNIIVMSMLGSLDIACPKMKDLHLPIPKWKEIYIECICILRLLYSSCKLVHADFSEYNLLYFYNHIYIIDVSQSMEHDHPHSLEFLKRDCLNITNFFKKKIGDIQKDQHANTLCPRDMFPDEQEHGGDTAASANAATANIQSSEDFYDNVQIMPLRKLFDYIVSSSLPEDVIYFLENDKKKICVNSLEIIYLQIFGLIKNSTPIPKLNLKRIKENRIYFEKLKRATCYYVTKCTIKNEQRLKKDPYKIEIEEQVFLSSWIPSHLNEIKDIKTIEKDIKLLRKGKSMAINFISNNYHGDYKYLKRNNNDVKHTNCDKRYNVDDDISRNILKKSTSISQPPKGEATRGHKTESTQNGVQHGAQCEHKDKQDENIDDNCKIGEDGRKIGEDGRKNGEDKLKNGEDNHKNGVDNHKNGEKETHGGLSGIEFSDSLENTSSSNKLSDEDESDTQNKEKNCLRSECEEIKFKGIIPEGVTRKEWSKLVKAQNREKRKHKIPNYTF
ncbi:serine/threonine protein kinase RIO1, putative (RIO1) [Plasmodium ovale curtisi]|uniref:non-specific serine/threonine protein kinase n=1 Tax=Plasmodium ovale curtisi TaxID=864141 RepID=A0A1A8X1G4_PLAOA|nr:serine/threonine protein kinase RIO1, putative (RIO1) [Plasmodium ovale curtisi]